MSCGTPIVALHLLFAAVILQPAPSRLRAQTPSPPTPTVDSTVEVLWGAKIPTRDSVRLNATIYRPAGAGPLPVVFTFTPYLGDSYHARATYFAKHGYVYALVDVRGRGNSEGRFEPMVNEGRDGYDVVEWLARQPWSNGKVAMWGGSYAGMDQWATAKEVPPHLVTIVPAAAAHPGVDFPFYQNIFYPYDLQWLTLTSGTTPNNNLFADSSIWIGRFQELYRRHLPFAALDSVVGNTSTVFQKWLEHPTPDAYWDAMVPTAAQYAKITIPILSITGYYDGDQRGALAFYREHLQAAPTDARLRHYLIIGPWDHAGTRTPAREVGGLSFGEKSLLDLNDLHRQWYDWTMKGGPKPQFLAQRIAYYMPGEGAEDWRHADSLDAIPAAPRAYHLGSLNAQAGDVFASGILGDSAPRGRSAPDRWTYDPLDIRPAELDREQVTNTVTDQRYALNLFGAGAVYHSPPLAEATEMVGSPRLTLWLAMDVPDADLGVTLYEIRSDGSSIALTDCSLRARYRESLRQAKPVKAGEVTRYDFASFQYFARRLAKGSRIRLVVQSINSIYAEKNYQGGGVVAKESARDARTAHIALYHDAKHPSVLEMPVVGATAAAATR
jgi:putative CocE/NonD family hydrolase